jgi:hypothetical protein
VCVSEVTPSLLLEAREPSVDLQEKKPTPAEFAKVSARAAIQWVGIP